MTKEDWTPEEVASFENWRANKAEARVKLLETIIEQTPDPKVLLAFQRDIDARYGTLLNTAAPGRSYSPEKEKNQQIFNTNGVRAANLAVWDKQAAHWDSIQWMVDPENTGTGRTTLLAAAFIKWADEHIGRTIRLWDHGGFGTLSHSQQPLHAAVVETLKHLQRTPGSGWVNKCFDLTFETLKRVS